MTLTEELRDMEAEDRPSKVEEWVGITAEEMVNVDDSFEEAWQRKEEKHERDK